MRRNSVPVSPSRSPRTVRPALALLAGLLAAPLALAPMAARAQCSYVPMASGVPQATGAATTNFTFTSPGGEWGAVGIRSAAGSDHDLGVFSQTAASPACVQGSVAASASPSGVDFVIGDFRVGRNAPGPWYAQANRVSGSGSAQAEWDAGGHSLVVDAPAVVDSSDHVLQVYDLFLEAGQSYVIVFQPAPGVDQKVLLFANPGSGPYWAARANALVQTAGTQSFPATTSDEYALVVVNDSGGHGAYSLAVDQCQPPVTLTSGTSVTTGLPLRFAIDQTTDYWSACAVRGAGSDDWDIFAYKTKTGALEPVCFTDSVAASQRRGPGTDVVVSDFNQNPTASYYTRVQQVAGSQPGVVEWDDGPDQIAVSAAPVSRTVGAGFVVEIWDVLLSAGQSYSIFFQKSGAVDAHYLVFENPAPGTPYWTGRQGAVFTGNASADYVPAVTGYHGLAVVSDNGGTGGFQLAVYGASSGVGALPGDVPAFGITALRPNPVLARASLTYLVGKPGHVAFDLLDVTGRQVARVAELDAVAGTGALDFEARSGGRRLPGGIYFVRMSEGRSTLSIRKFIVLP